MSSENRSNALIDPIRILLEGSSSALSEYEMIKQLQQQGWLEKIPFGDSVALYATHFLVYNALYQLRLEFQEEGRILYISPLSIELSLINKEDNLDLSASKSTNSASHGQNIGTCSQRGQGDIEPLQDYYLDMRHLERATQESVDQLINTFWDRMVNSDDSTHALAVLGFSDFSSTNLPPYLALKQRYRELAMKSHPDRGGKAEDFQAIQSAFALLKRCYFNEK